MSTPIEDFMTQDYKIDLLVQAMTHMLYEDPKGAAFHFVYMLDGKAISSEAGRSLEAAGNELVTRMPMKQWHRHEALRLIKEVQGL